MYHSCCLLRQPPAQFWREELDTNSLFIIIEIPTFGIVLEQTRLRRACGRLFCDCLLMWQVDIVKLVRKGFYLPFVCILRSQGKGGGIMQNAISNLGWVSRNRESTSSRTTHCNACTKINNVLMGLPVKLYL